jgi:tRNA/rRNA methyltransferase/tRNA (cytidine32/uridine32-2'-O)-methyltransferase
VPSLDAELTGRLRFVLCRPRNPQNVGAAARALRCAGISSWALVDAPWLDWDEARRLAVHAEELLETPARTQTLREALEGCVLSVGTTRRARPERPLLSPREAIARLSQARGPVAVVFGDERSGLTADEVEAVDLLSTLPSAPEQPSWNLAQAVAIYAYEARAAAVEPGAAALALPPPAGRAADPGALAAVDRALAETMEALAKPAARRRLFRSLERARLTGREATLWTAMWRAVQTRLRKA